MSPLVGYDAAFEAGHLALMKQRGAIAVGHYMTGDFAGSSAQPHAIRAAGMGAWLNWERLPNALVDVPRARGREIGVDFLDALDPACPRDDTVAGYFSVDVDVNEARLGACDEGFRGVRDVLDPAGIRSAAYAEMGVINHLCSNGILAGKQWLLMSEGFTPRGQYNPASPYVCAVQMHDVDGNWIGTDIPDTDRSTITDPRALGAWWNTGSPYAGGNGMPFTDQDRADIRAEASAAMIDVLAHFTQLLLDGQINTEFHGPGVAPFVDGKGLRGHLADTNAAVASLAQTVSNLQVGGLDPVAVATAIIAHMQITSK